MKISRDLDAKDLIRLLAKHGYQATRQSGSHIRLTTQTQGEHHITIPNHSPLKIGTLAAIVSEVAQHLGINREEVLTKK